MWSKHHTALNDLASDVESFQASVGTLGKKGHIEAIVQVVLPLGSCNPEDPIMVHELFVGDEDIHGVSGKPQQKSFKQATEILEQKHAICCREHHSKCSCWNAVRHGVLVQVLWRNRPIIHKIYLISIDKIIYMCIYDRTWP